MGTIEIYSFQALVQTCIMKITIVVIGILVVIIYLIMKLFPIKCPKCNEKCKESFYMCGMEDSLYYECPNHGDINNLI